MKKSRIVIPALAMIAFSMAASITGAVAWFTATRTASIDAGIYTVVRTTANLDVALSASGIGTTGADSGSTHTISVEGVLADASFDHTAAAKNIVTPDGNGTKVGAITGLTSATPTNMKRGQTNDNPAKNIYTAITWDIDFSVEFGGAAGDVALFLDTNLVGESGSEVANSRFVVTGSNTSDNNTATGFRMAFIPKSAYTSNAEVKVFAGLQTGSACKFVDTLDDAESPAVPLAVGDTLPAGTSYSGTTLIDKDYHGGTGGLPESFAAGTDVTARQDYFGTFVYATNQTVHLEYTVVCWFEGTDPNVVNGKVLQSVQSYLSFKAINVPAANA